MIHLLLFVLLAGTLSAYAFFVYLRAELPVRGGRLLALIRAAALVLLLALLFNPTLPWSPGTDSGARWVLLDASLSMSAVDGHAWAEALSRARSLEAEGWRVVPFGTDFADSVAAEPQGVRSHLAPVIARAAEAGVTRLRILSDLRLDDPVEVASALASIPAEVSFEPFGGTLTNAGIASFAVSDQARPGEGVRAEVEVFAEGVADSLLVEVREEGRLIATKTEPAPGAGLRGRVLFDLPAPAGQGRVRYTTSVRVLGDAFPSDDEASVYVSAGSAEGGLLVISLRPDWEPRALLGVLAEATGLPATGYLRVGADRFLPMGVTGERGPAVDSSFVGAAATDAALLVVHGLSERADAWTRTLSLRSNRLLVWPTDAGGAAIVGVTAGAPSSGEWYASPQVPPSPLAADLAGSQLLDLPPLSATMSVTSNEPLTVPLDLQLRGVGPTQPGLVLNRLSGRRQAVVLASGFWRWAARDGAGRDAHRRLWSAVAGWLLAPDSRLAALEVRPELRTVPRGDDVRWRIPGGAADSIRLEILADTVAVVDTRLGAGTGVSSGGLDPGTYRYRATGPAGVVGEGRFDVEARTTEMLSPPRTPETVQTPLTAGLVGDQGRPLRTLPWPYIAVLVLLSAEWVGRRRAGLR